MLNGCFNGSITEEEFVIGQEYHQSRVELQLQNLYGFELLLIEPSRPLAYITSSGSQKTGNSDYLAVQCRILNQTFIRTLF